MNPCPPSASPPGCLGCRGGVDPIFWALGPLFLGPGPFIWAPGPYYMPIIPLCGWPYYLPVWLALLSPSVAGPSSCQKG